ncbi:hypothetical protein JYB88_12320 [Shewanella cyperi]|uniref:Extradiol ring-cleavage dioxygenase LigAB LigA subunit domain-containing protein n=1 Tax=Shewanella cyperi TaxID=2814292 RepID=A0A974XR91_9GAMM|nr:hypothetical protein [Shewanella cyperi]QSX29034.1 hypothetical protein JYB88_12320 [Shewanella cyperi]
MSKLTDFLKKLGEDATLLDAYKKDPEGVMRQHGLTDEEIAAIMAGDMQKLKGLTGDGNYQMFVIINHGNN